MDRVDELQRQAPLDRQQLVDAVLADYQERGEPVSRALVEQAVTELTKTPQTGTPEAARAGWVDTLKGGAWVLGTVLVILVFFRLALPLLERLFMWL